MPYWCRDCQSYFSVKTGTPVECSRLPLRKWIVAMYLMTTSLKSVSSMKLHRDLGVSQKTAWFMIHRIRKVWEEDRPISFSGPAEVGETYMGGRERNKHAGSGLGHDKADGGVGGRNEREAACLARVSGGLIFTPLCWSVCYINDTQRDLCVIRDHHHTCCPSTRFERAGNASKDARLPRPRMITRSAPPSHNTSRNGFVSPTTVIRIGTVAGIDRATVMSSPICRRWRSAPLLMCVVPTTGRLASAPLPTPPGR